MATHIHTRSRGLGAGLAMAILAAALAGCTVYAPAQPAVYGAAGPVYVQTPPPAPAPVQEVITVRPSLDVIWIPGAWVWGGSRYAWRAGHWSRPPASHTQWVAGQWQHTPRGHVWQDGHWRR